MSHLIRKSVDQISKIECSTYEKLILLSYGMLSGMCIGYSIGTLNLFGFFTWRKWKNRYVSTKMFLNNYKIKTFYIDGDITEEMVDSFKSFMQKVKPTETIDIIIDTNGGLFCGAQMISDIILSHCGTTNAIVLSKAFSAGALIALSCTNLYMHNTAHMSPVDVQQGNLFETVQLSSVDTIIKNKTADKINDSTFILADQAAKCKTILDELFDKIIKPRYDENISSAIKLALFDGQKYVHSKTFSTRDLRNIGLNIQNMENNMIDKASCKIEKDPKKFLFF